MRVTTTTKAGRAIGSSERIGKGSDFELALDGYSAKLTQSGLIVFGPEPEEDLTECGVDINLNWSSSEKRLRMQYILEKRATGLLLGGYTKPESPGNILPEKRFHIVKGIEGFEMDSDDSGSSFQFGDFIDDRDVKELFLDKEIPEMSHVHATRFIIYHLDPLISLGLEQRL